MTLLQYKNYIDILLEKYPHLKNATVLYFNDEEGNILNYCNNLPTPAILHTDDETDEVGAEFDDININKANSIIIN